MADTLQIEVNADAAASSSNNPSVTAVQNQCNALMTKNFRILTRRPFMMLQFVLFPILTVLLLSAFNAGLNDARRATPLNVNGITVSIPKKCNYFSAKALDMSDCAVDDSRASLCISLVYSPSPHVKADAIMQSFAKAAGFTIVTDTTFDADTNTDANTKEYILPTFDVVGVATKKEVAALIVDHHPHVDAAVVFDLDKDPDGLSFELQINHTRTQCYAKAGDPFHYVALHQSLSQAAIQAHTNVDTDVNVKLAPFPDAKAEAGLIVPTYPASLVPWAGALFVMVGVAGASLVVFNLIADEHRNMLVTSMRMMGLIEVVYWGSWLAMLFFITILPVSLATTLVMQWTPLLVFTECDFAVHWIALLLFLTSMFAMAMMFGSCVHSPVRVQIVSALLLMVVVVFQAVVATTNSGIINTWEANYNPTASAFWLVAWNVLPWWHYGKIFQTILDTTGVRGQINSATLSTSSSGFVNSTSLFIPPNSTYYNWTNIYEPLGQKGSKRGLPFEADYDMYGEVTGDGWYAPSTADSFGFLIALTCMYLALAWYFGQVIGARMSVVFCLHPTYWGCRNHKTGFVAGDTFAKIQSESLRDGTLRTHKMSKAYDGNTALVRDVFVREQDVPRCCCC